MLRISNAIRRAMEYAGRMFGKGSPSPTSEGPAPAPQVAASRSVFKSRSEESWVNIPRVAEAVFTKQVHKRHAVALVKAHHGADGVEQLNSEISLLRKRWLPRPGTIQRTSDGATYGVARDGSLRRFVTQGKPFDVGAEVANA